MASVSPWRRTAGCGGKAQGKLLVLMFEERRAERVWDLTPAASGSLPALCTCCLRPTRGARGAHLGTYQEAAGWTKGHQSHGRCWASSVKEWRGKSIQQKAPLGLGGPNSASHWLCDHRHATSPLCASTATCLNPLKHLKTLPCEGARRIK